MTGEGTTGEGTTGGPEQVARGPRPEPELSAFGEMAAVQPAPEREPEPPAVGEVEAAAGDAAAGFQPAEPLADALSGLSADPSAPLLPADTPADVSAGATVAMLIPRPRGAVPGPGTWADEPGDVPVPKSRETEAQRRLRWRREYDEMGVKTRRSAPWLLGGFLSLIVVVFVAALVVDHERQATPEGAVRSWIGAAAAGDCERYLALETPDAKAQDLAIGVPQAFQAEPATITSPEERVCRTLLQRFKTFTILGETQLTTSGDATVVQVITVAGTVSVPVVHADGHWKVDDAALRTCSIGPKDVIPGLAPCNPA